MLGPQRYKYNQGSAVVDDVAYGYLLSREEKIEPARTVKYLLISVLKRTDAL